MGPTSPSSPPPPEMAHWDPPAPPYYWLLMVKTGNLFKRVHLRMPHLASDIWWPRLETCSNSFTWAPPPAGDIWWLRVETCSNLFVWGCPELTSGGNWSNSYGWCKRVVRILLECYLVVTVFSLNEKSKHSRKWFNSLNDWFSFLVIFCIK